MIIGISGKAQSGKNLICEIIRYLIAINKHAIRPIEKLEPGVLYTESGWQQKAFATKVKEVLSLLTGIPVEDMEKEEIKNSYLGEEWNRWIVAPPDKDLIGKRLITSKYFSTEKEGEDYYKSLDSYGMEAVTLPVFQRITVRRALQWIGTDLFRDKFHPNCWTNALMNEYKWDNESLTEGWRPTYYNPDNSGGDIEAEPLMPNWVITDVRFSNEVKAIVDRGGIIIRVNRRTSELERCLRDPVYFYEKYTRVNKEKTKLKDVDKAYILKYFTLKKEHISETALDDYDNSDYVIDNNESIEKLIEKVKQILIKEKLKGIL